MEAIILEPGNEADFESCNESYKKNKYPILLYW